MSTTTKTRPAKTDDTDTSLARIEDASPRFVAPDPQLLPPELHPAVERVCVTRAAWITALHHKRVANRAAQAAERDHTNALLEAAMNGGDQSAVKDERPGKLHAATAATEAAKAAERAVETRWLQLVDLLAAHRDAVLAMNAPTLAHAESELAELEVRYRDARRHAERLRDQSAWFSTIGRSNHNKAATEKGIPFQ